MRERVRPGPEPFRRRLQQLDATKLADGVKSLVEYAQGHGEGLRVPDLELLEAVLTAVDAAKGRAHLAARKPVLARYLAALASVSSAYVRKLARAGALRRIGQKIEAESALRWLHEERPIAPTMSHVIDLSPPWWEHTTKRFAMIPEVQRRAQELVPEPCKVEFDRNYRPIVKVPFEARMDADAAERVRRTVVESLAELNPFARRGGDGTGVST